MSADDEAPLSDEEQALLAWLDAQDGSAPPAELLARFGRLPQLLNCVRQLEALGGPQAERRAVEMSLSSVMTLPREFGPYDLEEELGRGGMGVVYKARHRTLGAHFALKVIRTSEFASAEEVRRFFREAQAASRLRHPHIVSVHDAGEIDGRPFLVMQYIGGQTLADRLRTQRPSLDAAVRILLPVVRAVAYLHEQGIVHRDLKPGNILIDERGRPCVTDFGLVKLFDAEGGQTATGAVIGTPAYMSPEQAWGRPEDVTAASDLYALGAILYELLTGRAPFVEPNSLELMLRLRDAEPRPPRTLHPQVPVELEQICLRCLEKKPELRYASAVELADDLERHLCGEPITLRPLSWRSRLHRWVRRAPALASHLAGFATMALIVQAADLLAPRQRAAYLPEMSILALWTALCVILQQLLLRDVPGVRVLWVATDAVLFTLAAGWAEGPIESLAVGYALLIAASGLWYRPSLVILMTASSVISYGALLLVRGAAQPGHYPFIVAGILAVIGGVVTALVRRIRQLVDHQPQA